MTEVHHVVLAVSVDVVAAGRTPAQAADDAAELARQALQDHGWQGASVTVTQAYRKGMRP